MTLTSAPFSNPGVFNQPSGLLSLAAVSSNRLLIADENEGPLSAAEWGVASSMGARVTERMEGGCPTFK